MPLLLLPHGRWRSPMIPVHWGPSTSVSHSDRVWGTLAFTQWAQQLLEVVAFPQDLAHECHPSPLGRAGRESRDK